MQDNYWKEYWEASSRDVNNIDVHRQVLRVLNKQPINEQLFEKLLAYVTTRLELKSNHVVLDLCCGNGLITSHIASVSSKVVGVDFTDTLIGEISKRKFSEKITGIVSDITKVEFEPESFDRVFMYAGLQYVNEKHTIELIKKIHTWLKKGGIAFIGDIPDRDRIWNFYNSREREAVYFNEVLTDTPIIGNWYTPLFLEKLAAYSGFSSVELLYQPTDFIYAHYRYDILLKKQS